MRFPWLIVAAFFGMSAVILGALGAHAVDFENDSGRLHTLALNFQMFSIIPYIAVEIIIGRGREGRTLANLAALLNTVGILFFSGSLQLLAFFDHAVGFNITPTGGVCLILAWLLLGIAAFQSWRNSVL